jgi:hypothetical protein
MSTTAELLAISDPFSILYDAVVEHLRGFAPLASLVKPGNYCVFNGAQEDPRKGQVQDADFPELMLTVASATAPKPWGASDLSTIVERMSLMVSTGTLKTLPLFKVRWALIRAVAAMQPGTNIVLDLPFVTDVQFSSESLAAADQGNKREGWVDVFGLDFTMNFDRGDLEV